MNCHSIRFSDQREHKFVIVDINGVRIVAIELRNSSRWDRDTVENGTTVFAAVFEFIRSEILSSNDLLAFSLNGMLSLPRFSFPPTRGHYLSYGNGVTDRYIIDHIEAFCVAYAKRFTGVKALITIQVYVSSSVFKTRLKVLNDCARNSRKCIIQIVCFDKPISVGVKHFQCI